MRFRAGRANPHDDLIGSPSPRTAARRHIPIDGAARRPDAVRVLLVDTPFAGLRPAMGLNLLAGHPHALGAEARPLHANLRFADQVGPADYRYVAERCPSQAPGGDRVFVRAAFGPPPTPTT